MLLHPRPNGGNGAGKRPPETRTAELFEGTRWLVVDSDCVAADAIACELREAGCVVRLIDPAGQFLPRLSTFDAHVVLVDAAQDTRFLQERLSLHPGLRWASLVRVPFTDLWSLRTGKFSISALTARAASSLELDATLKQLVRTGPERVTPNVQQLGPTRILRAVCANNDLYRIRFSTHDQEARIEVAGTLVLGAWYQAGNRALVIGEAAFANAMELHNARVTVERKIRLDDPSLVIPLDEAIALAMETLRDKREDDESPTLRMLSADTAPEEGLPSDTRPLARSHESTLMEMMVEASPLPQFNPRIAELFSGNEERIDSLQAVPAEDKPRPSMLSMLSMLRFEHVERWFAIAAAGVAVLLLLVVWVPRVARIIEASFDEPSARPLEPVMKSPEKKAAASRPQRAAVVEKSKPAASAQKALLLPQPAPTSADNAAPVPAEEAEPKSGHALEAAARKALRKGDVDKALEWAEKAVALRPKRASVRVLYGDILAAHGKAEAALTQYRIAQQKKPRSKEIEQRIARVTPQRPSS